MGFAGTELNNGHCTLQGVCLTGTAMATDSKTSRTQCCPDGKLAGDSSCEDPFCPGGFAFDAEACVYDQPPLCSDGVLFDGACILTEPVACADYSLSITYLSKFGSRCCV